MDNTEVIFYLHSIREPKYFKDFPIDSLTNKYLKSLFHLTKDFYVKYKDVPFDPNDPTFEQIEEVLGSEEGKKYYMLDSDLPQEKNKSVFLSNCKTILANNYSRYNKDRVDESIKSWINWENFQNSFVTASEYMKSARVTPETTSEVINKAHSILNGYKIVGENDELAKDFFDPDTHTEGEDDLTTFETGWESFDLLVNSSRHSRGVKNKNVIILVGAPNIGKTIFLGNIAYQLCINSANVLFISLEMEEYDMAHRIGANAFNLTMDGYESSRGDIDKIIDNYNKSTAGGTKPRGKFLLKRMYSPSPREIDQAVKQEERENDCKINVVVLDYLTEMGNDEGIRMDNAFNTYMYHKTNVGNLYDNAGMGSYTVVTGHQSGAIDQEAMDINLTDLAESKGIQHAPDGIIGIIQNTTMKGNKEYYLKGLKTRHSKYKNHYVRFKVDYQHMRLECGALYTPDEYTINGARPSDGGDMTSSM